MVVLDGFRSTKGASKQRRDLINVEIGNLRDLLPLQESSRQRLSQLQVMSLACCYIRKCNYFARLFGNMGFTGDQHYDFSQSMTGFMIITTREGKLLYISENVTEFLGHSMVDVMTQGDSFYDIIDKRDHAVVQGHLLSAATAAAASAGPSGTDERAFFCRMNLSRSFRRQSGFGESKVMHVSGHFIQPLLRDHYGNQPVFIAMCSPLVTPDGKDTLVQHNTMVFHSVHGLDMKFIEISSNGEHHLGYTDSDLYSKSWYELLHPEDMMEAKEKHIQLIKSSHEMGCMLTVRLQSKEGQWVWVNTVMNIRQPFLSNNEEPAIVCINQVIADGEAQQFKLQSQLYSSHIARSPEFLSSPQASSPPHTITQVPVERDSMPQHHGQKPTYYQGEFTFTALGSDEGDVPGTSQQPPTTVGSPYSDHGHEYNSGSNSPPSQLRRADIISRLKRKMEMSNQHCKPKVSRYNCDGNGDNSNGSFGGGMGDINVHGLFVDTFDSLAPLQSATLAEAVDMMGPVVGGHVFAELNLKKEMKEEVLPMAPSSLADFPQPMTPPTPSSVRSEPGTTRLTIDVCEVPITVPSGMLTPEPSPASSPDHCVPSIYEIEETFMTDLEEGFAEAPKVKKPVVQKAAKPLQFKLPELDVLSLENFLASVEQPVRAAGKPLMTVVEDTALRSQPAHPANQSAVTTPPENLEQQFSSLMASVNETLMELVQGVSGTADIVGEFQLVPNVAHGSPMSDCSDETTLSEEDFTTISGGLLSELTQLNHLTANSPRYGEEAAIPTTVFDPNL